MVLVYSWLEAVIDHEAVIDIKLGAVLRDPKKDVDYVYIGRTKNTVGYNYHFAPDRQAYAGTGMTATFAKLKSALQKFPSLKDYLVRNSGN